MAKWCVNVWHSPYQSKYVRHHWRWQISWVHIFLLKYIWIIRFLRKLLIRRNINRFSQVDVEPDNIYILISDKVCEQNRPHATPIAIPNFLYLMINSLRVEMGKMLIKSNWEAFCKDFLSAEPRPYFLRCRCRQHRTWCETLQTFHTNLIFVADILLLPGGWRPGWSKYFLFSVMNIWLPHWIEYFVEVPNKRPSITHV